MALLDGDFFSTPDQGMLSMPGGPGTPFTGPNAMAWLRARGWSDPAAAGLIGGFTQESSLRPSVWGDRGMSYGLGQWNRGRLNALHNFGGDYRDPWTQLAFANSELQPGGPESKAGDAFRAATTPEQAVTADRMYERPSADDFGKRLNYTNALMRGDVPPPGAGVGKAWGKSAGEPDDMNPNIASATDSMFSQINPISTAQAADTPPDQTQTLGNTTTVPMTPGTVPAPQGGTTIPFTLPRTPQPMSPLPQGNMSPIPQQANMSPVPPAAPSDPTTLPQVAGIDPNATMTQDDKPMPTAQQPGAQQPSGGGGSAMPPTMQEYLRMIQGGGQSWTNRLGLALMAMGTNGGGPAAQNLMSMAMQERERQMQWQMENYPKQMAYEALIKQGVNPQEAFMRAYAPGVLGTWEPFQAGYDSAGNPVTNFVNKVTGQKWNGQGQPPSLLNAGGQTGAAPAQGTETVPGQDAPGEPPVGPARLAWIREHNPTLGNQLDRALAGELDPNKDMQFARFPALKNKLNMEADLVTRDPDNPNELGDYDSEKMKTARGQYEQLASNKPGTAGAAIRGADQGLKHFSQAVASQDNMNKELGLLSSNEWGPATALLNQGKISLAKLEQDPSLARYLPPSIASAYEGAKFFKGSGDLSNASIDHFMGLFHPGMTAQEQDAANKEFATMMSHAYSSYYNKYQQSPASFLKRYPMPATFSSDSLGVLKRYDARPDGMPDSEWNKVIPLGVTPPPIGTKHPGADGRIHAYQGGDPAVSDNWPLAQ